tara:strand:- start:1819 stop:2667 length:849 start_codon:yes stop_codon:yes gene_type:complete
MNIALISFDRADYIESVLKSLKKQTFQDFKLYWFNDGLVNKYSWRRAADLTKVTKCCNLAKEYFPDCEIFLSDANIGIAENWRRAEVHMFYDLGLDECVFMEDDLELTSPYYLETLNNMFDAFRDDEEIGMFSAFGETTSVKTPGVMKNMGHLWAFGTTKKAWEKRQEVFYDEYYNFVKGTDFVFRDRDGIRNLYQKYGGKWEIADSQDGAICLASMLADQIHISTEVNLATYIGEVGMHFNTQTYNNMGFNRTPLYNEGAIKEFTVDKEKIKKIQRKEFLK